MHGLVSEDALCIRSLPDIVDLDGDDLVCRDVCKELKVAGLICADPVPCIQDQLCVLAVSCLDNCPALFDIRNSGIRHRLDTDDPLACSLAELSELLSGMLDRVVLHQAAVDLLDTEQLAHMEAHLLFVFLLIGTVVLCPLNNVLNLSTFHAVLVKNCKNILVMKSLCESIYISLCTKSDSIVACFLGCDYTILKFALISQCPGTDCDGVLSGHYKLLSIKAKIYALYTNIDHKVSAY